MKWLISLENVNELAEAHQLTLGETREMRSRSGRKPSPLLLEWTPQAAAACEVLGRPRYDTHISCHVRSKTSTRAKHVLLSDSRLPKWNPNPMQRLDVREGYGGCSRSSQPSTVRSEPVWMPAIIRTKSMVSADENKANKLQCLLNSTCGMHTAMWGVR